MVVVLWMCVNSRRTVDGSETGGVSLFRWCPTFPDRGFGIMTSLTINLKQNDRTISCRCHRRRKAKGVRLQSCRILKLDGVSESFCEKMWGWFLVFVQYFLRRVALIVSPNFQFPLSHVTCHTVQYDRACSGSLSFVRCRKCTGSHTWLDDWGTRRSEREAQQLKCCELTCLRLSPCS